MRIYTGKYRSMGPRTGTDLKNRIPERIFVGSGLSEKH